MIFFYDSSIFLRILRMFSYTNFSKILRNHILNEEKLLSYLRSNFYFIFLIRSFIVKKRRDFSNCSKTTLREIWNFSNLQFSRFMEIFARDQRQTQYIL